jgi:hypothetical protein
MAADVEGGFSRVQEINEGYAHAHVDARSPQKDAETDVNVELRCEGVNSNALGLVFCKDIFAHLSLRTFFEMG